jgi:hypothetical protein
MVINLLLRRASLRRRLKASLAVSLLACSLALGLIPPGVGAQGKGVVEGRLINKTDPSILPAGVDLDVIGLGGGMSILKSAKTDRSGRFRIDGLATDTPMMIQASYRDVNYHGQVRFDASGKAEVEISVYETTSSMAGIRLDSARYAFQRSGDGLRGMELYSFNNMTSPPKSYTNTQGNFRFDKAPGITEPPKMNVTGPGSAMPLIESPLESSDGQYYYSVYPLRPGITTFEIDQQLPYTGGSYTFRQKFYYDVDSYEVGVIPQDMTVTGTGLVKLQTDPKRNFSVYQGGPVKAGTEVVWTFAGGTPVVEPSPAESQGETRVQHVPGIIARNALILGPLVLIGFVVVLWYAVNRIPEESAQVRDSRIKELKMRRDQLLNFLAALDSQYENQALDRRQYVRQRDQGKRQLLRISLLLKK